MVLPRLGANATEQEQLAVIFKGTIRGDIKRFRCCPSAINNEHAPRADAIADAELIVNIRIGMDKSATTTSAVTSSKNMSVRMSPAEDSLSARTVSQPAARRAGSMRRVYTLLKSTAPWIGFGPPVVWTLTWLPNGITTKARSFKEHPPTWFTFSQPKRVCSNKDDRRTDGRIRIFRARVGRSFIMHCLMRTST
jgi:hypothetical protein